MISECVHYVIQELEDEEERILREVAVFVLASDFMWACWSIVQAHISQINFGYMVRCSISILRMEMTTTPNEQHSKIFQEQYF